MKLKLWLRISRRILNHIDLSAIFEKWWILPFNGQANRTATVYQLCGSFKPNSIIETGTYFGTTSIFFSKLAGNIHTIEINPKTAKIAKSRFRNLGTEINLHVGSSIETLATILVGLDPKSQRVLCYLDAHWESYLPLKEELSILCNWGGNFVAIIDDFENPIYPEYGFDKYGDSIVGIDMIPQNMGLSLLVPNEPAICETGAKRGTGYVFSSGVLEGINPEITQRMKHITLK